MIQLKESVLNFMTQTEDLREKILLALREREPKSK